MNFSTLIKGKWLKSLLSARVAEQHNLDQYRRKYPQATIARDCSISGPVTLGDGVSIRSGVHIAGEVNIGRATYLNGPAELRAGTEKIELGSFCSCAAGLTMLCSNHPISHPSSYHTRAGKFRFLCSDITTDSSPIEVGSDVWIGSNCTILKGVTVGHGAILAAGAVVTKNVECYSIVGGVPASPIRSRFPPHVIDWLLHIQWWNWTDDELRSRKFFFEAKLDDLDHDELKGLESRLT